jgi:hypothetical protein
MKWVGKWCLDARLLDMESRGGEILLDRRGEARMAGRVER